MSTNYAHLPRQSIEIFNWPMRINIGRQLQFSHSVYQEPTFRVGSSPAKVHLSYPRFHPGPWEEPRVQSTDRDFAR